MKNILYLMHIDWGWIKKRPQFIAEGLSKYYNVYLLYKHTYNKKSFQKNKSQKRSLHLAEVMCLPNKLSQNKLGILINTAIWKKNIKECIMKKKPIAIYITSPEFISYIPRDYQGCIIYDCMDDHFVLEGRDKNKDKIVADESQATSRANIILVTSLELKSILNEIYKNINKKLHLIRNGFNGPILSIPSLINKKKNKVRITYFGTISSWFNFDYLERSLNDFPNIEYYLYGPVDSNVKVPQNDRIHFKGIVEHDELFKEIKYDDVLIMPFVLNDIVKAVDPVKLYEYINFYKNILVIKYPEIDRFKKFVYFYDDYTQYKQQMTKLIKNSQIKYTPEERKKFLEENDWNTRVDRIYSLIEKEVAKK